MYYFNHELLKELPSVMGITQKELVSKAGIGQATYSVWKKGSPPDVETFIGMLNSLHISMAEFLVLDENPKLKDCMDEYIIPKELWTPIKFTPENLSLIAGRDSLTGIPTYKDAVIKLGMKSNVTLRQWIKKKTGMRMNSLLNIINSTGFPVRMLIEDSNRNIQVPERVEQVIDICHVKNSVLQRKDAMIHNLKREVLNLEKENRSLQRVTPERYAASEGVADPYYGYAPTVKKGYIFHKELWFSLPELYGKTDLAFCTEIGLEYYSFRRKTNPSVSDVIKTCNMLHISIAHFFPPKSENLQVYDRFYYEIPSTKFIPIVNRTDNLKYIFGRYSIFGYTRDSLKKKTGTSEHRIKMYTKGEGEELRVYRLTDICSRFSISPFVFMEDNNKNYHPAYSISQNELLIRNCIEMKKEIETLRKQVKRFKGNSHLKSPKSLA